MEENTNQVKNTNGMAIASLILGIVGLVAWLIPLIGYPVNIIGLVLGIISNKKQKTNFLKLVLFYHL